jgi:hypothetical protein
VPANQDAGTAARALPGHPGLMNLALRPNVTVEALGKLDPKVRIRKLRAINIGLKTFKFALVSDYIANEFIITLA